MEKKYEPNLSVDLDLESHNISGGKIMRKLAPFFNNETNHDVRLRMVHAFRQASEIIDRFKKENEQINPYPSSFFFLKFQPELTHGECSHFGFVISTNCWANAKDAEKYIEEKLARKKERREMIADEKNKEKMKIVNFLIDQQLVEASTVITARLHKEIFFYNTSKRQLHLQYMEQSNCKIKYKKFLRLFPGYFCLKGGYYHLLKNFLLLQNTLSLRKNELISVAFVLRQKKLGEKKSIKSFERKHLKLHLSINTNLKL